MTGFGIQVTFNTCLAQEKFMHGKQTDSRARPIGAPRPGKRSSAPKADGDRQTDRPAQPKRRNGRSVKPVWDGKRRELWFGGVLVKRFRRSACCQEAILAAFQEEGWPERIDDPLSPISGKCAKIRLHNAINCLNRSHRARLICFRANGSGTGVRWELVKR